MAQIIPLTVEEAAMTGFTQKIVLTYADVVGLTSGTAASIYPTFNTAVNVPAGTYIQDMIGVVKTAFAGGTGTLTYGVSDGTNQYIATATDLKTAGYTAGYNLTKPVMMTGSTQVQITVTAGTGITGWTAGELHIYINLANVALLDR